MISLSHPATMDPGKSRQAQISSIKARLQGLIDNAREKPVPDRGIPHGYVQHTFVGLDDYQLQMVSPRMPFNALPSDFRFDAASSYILEKFEQALLQCKISVVAATGFASKPVPPPAAETKSKFDYRALR